MKRQFYCPRRFSPLSPSLPENPSRKIDRDLAMNKQEFCPPDNARSWVNYVSINIPYCITKYSKYNGIHRALEPHELFNRRYTPPLNIEKTVELGESRDFWHQVSPVIPS